MTGASPIVMDLAAVRKVLAAARALGGPIGTSIELCILTLALPWAVVAIRLERIDWQEGVVPIPARGGRERLLHLPVTARSLILRIAGEGAGDGQAVTAGRGEPLKARHLRLDRVLPRLVGANGAPLQSWNFHGIRLSGAMIMSQHGVCSNTMLAIFGQEWRRSTTPLAGWHLNRAGPGIERWNAIINGR